jgi:glyoxylase-like metal-dependent hydrolase (beta-lactamase superfamily II)
VPVLSFPLALLAIAVHILIMREILPGIFTWGSTYADRPWDLNGYAIVLAEATVLIDPPTLEEAAWQKLPKPITTVVLTNRDHVRDAAMFRTKYGARIVAGQDEVQQFSPLTIDAVVQEGDMIGGAMRVIHLPGKSPGEIGLYLEPAYHAVSEERGGILILGDAIIGNPPGALGLIPEEKLDHPKTLRESLPRILDYQFEVLLLCDGQPVLRDAKQKVSDFLKTLG